MKAAFLHPVLLAAVVSSGCGGHDSHESAAVTVVWSCLIGTEGGFTGGGDGYEIHSDGRVVSWSRSTADAEVEKRQIGQADTEQLQPLLQALAVRELHTIALQESGNLTTFLESRSSLQPTQRWSWPADRMGGRTAKVPALVHDAYEAALALARQFGGSR